MSFNIFYMCFGYLYYSQICIYRAARIFCVNQTYFHELYRSDDSIAFSITLGNMKLI